MNNVSKSLLNELQDKIENTSLSHQEKALILWTASLVHELDEEVTSKEFCEKFIFPRAGELELSPNTIYYLGKKYDGNLVQQAVARFTDMLNKPETQELINAARDNFSQVRQVVTQKINDVLNEFEKTELDTEQKRVIKILERSLTSQPEKWRSERYTLIHEKGLLCVGSIKGKRSHFKVVYENEVGEEKTFIFESSDFAKIYFGFVETLKENMQNFEDHLIGD